MKKDYNYKIGDRVIVTVLDWNFSESHKKGVIEEVIDGRVDTPHPFKSKYHKVYIVKCEDSNGNFHTHRSLQLDVQYYRELRLKKILDKI